MHDHDARSGDRASGEAGGPRAGSRARPSGAAPTVGLVVAPHALNALQKTAGNRVVRAFVQRTGPAGPGGPGAGQPLTELAGADAADFGQQLVQATAGSRTALDDERSTLPEQLPARPTPTGLPVADVAPVPAPTEPAPPAALPPLGADAGAGQADQLAQHGSAALHQAAAGADVTVPRTTELVRPTQAPGELPAFGEPPAPVVPAAPAPIRATGDERAALNATMNAETRELTAPAVAPAVEAGVAHRADVAAARTSAEQSVAAAEAESAGEQRAVGARADAEVRQLHAGWQREKAGVVASSQGQIQAEAGQARSEAARTMSEARAQADAQTNAQAKVQTEVQAEVQNGQAAASAQRDARPGIWDRVASAGSRAVGAVRHVASAGLGIVGGIVDAARRQVFGLLTRLNQVVRDRIDAAVTALRDGVRRVGAAIAEAIRRGRELVGRLAAALAAAAQRAWAAARRRLVASWSTLTAAVGRALAAAAAVARRIADAFGKVRQIVQLLGNRLLGFMAEVVANPEEKVGRPLVALAAPFAAAVPAKAEQMGAEQAGGGPRPQSAAAVQRQVTVPPAPEGETFWQGIKRHAKAAGEAFLEHWVMNLLKVVASILLFPIAACMELPALWRELVGIFTPAPGGTDRLDHLLGLFRQAVNIAGLIVAGVGVWAFLIGLAFPPAEPFLGAGYYAISAGVLAADLVVGAAQLANAYAGVLHAASPEQRELYLGMFSGSLIGGAITIVMVLLGAAAARLARVFRNLRARTAGAAAGAGKTRVPSKGEPPPVRDEGPAPRPVVEPPRRFGRPEDGYVPDRMFMDFINHEIPSEGWKLHVSADAASAPAVADAVLPRLRQMGVNHKVVGSLESLQGMSGGQQAKFITIYPDNVAQARQIVSAVDSAVSGVSGGAPPVAGELGVGSSGRVYTRYGGFTKDTVTGPDGAQVHDQRGRICPPWVENPWTSQPPRTPLMSGGAARGGGSDDRDE